MSKSGYVTKKNTFWNNLRAKNGYTYQVLASTLDCGQSQVGKWFSGEVRPGPKYEKAICDLFGVDYTVGHNEFMLAHQAWVSDRAERTGVAPAPKRRVGRPRKNPVESKPAVVVTTVDAEPEEDNAVYSKILKSVYGNISYEDYEAMRMALIVGEDPREAIYGKASFDDYVAIDAILKGVGCGK